MEGAAWDEERADLEDGGDVDLYRERWRLSAQVLERRNGVNGQQEAQATWWWGVFPRCSLLDARAGNQTRVGPPPGIVDSVQRTAPAPGHRGPLSNTEYSLSSPRPRRPPSPSRSPSAAPFPTHQRVPVLTSGKVPLLKTTVRIKGDGQHSARHHSKGSQSLEHGPEREGERRTRLTEEASLSTGSVSDNDELAAHDIVSRHD